LSISIFKQIGIFKGAIDCPNCKLNEWEQIDKDNIKCIHCNCKADISKIQPLEFKEIIKKEN
jgi:hypothetical protein